VIHKSPAIRALAIVPILTLMAWGQQAPVPDASPESSAQASPQASPETQEIPSPTPTATPNAAIDNLENALRDHQNAQTSEVAGDPNKPRTHRFTNQPIGTVLRVLAEEAMINYVEPALNPEERISIILPSMTPIQAFYAIAEARGFRVIKRRGSDIITLQRSDINTPSYYVVRAYKLRYVTAPDLAQAVSGFLGIPMRPVSSTNPAYPPVANGQGGAAAYAGAPEGKTVYTAKCQGCHGANGEGKAAIANARLVYQEFTRIFHTPRFETLKHSGAHVQRPLWASTSTKNPAYRDVLYAEELIGPDTVDTMPLETIENFRDHGRVSRTVENDIQQAKDVFAALEKVGIHYDQVTKQLQDEGVQKFADSFHALFQGIESKKQVIQERTSAR